MPGVGATESAFALFLVIGGIIFIAATVFWMWMFLDCVKKVPDSAPDKLLWLFIIGFTHLAGALIYFLFRRPKRIQTQGK